MGNHRRQPRDGPCTLGWRREHRLCNHRPWLRREEKHFVSVTTVSVTTVSVTPVSVTPVSVTTEEKHFVDILLDVRVNIHVIVALALHTSGAVPVASGTGRFPSVCGAAELGKGAGNLVWDRL